jgi:hypothetical protein
MRGNVAMVNDGNLRLGLILDPEFYMLDKAVVALTPELIRALCSNFDTRLIYDQDTFDKHCREVDILLSMEPKWAAPVLRWDRCGRFRRSLPKCPCLVLMSDPHIEQWRQRYFLNQGLDYILALYYDPFLRHFTSIPTQRLVHFPWSVPSEWIMDDPISYAGQLDVMLFGASADPAYNVRNWCREQEGVESYQYSGVENKVLKGRAYFEWLRGFDAVVAAGSSDPKYGLTTPKYFETAAAGSLLFAQDTPDLERLGFKDGVNCVVEKISLYRSAPGDPRWLALRRAGRELISHRHTINERLSSLRALATDWRGR